MNKRPMSTLEGRRKRESWEALSPEIQAKAISIIREHVVRQEQIHIAKRIFDDPESWWMGRANIPCSSCRTGVVGCKKCHGAGMITEFPIHFGWGMAIRNLLRTHGLDEQAAGINNWDDYYIAVIEVAMIGIPEWMDDND
jgi:hypothetical protein